MSEIVSTENECFSCSYYKSKMPAIHDLLNASSDYMHEQASEIRDLRIELNKARSSVKTWRILTALWFALDIVELLLHIKGAW